jgi:hypothetical protein
MSKPANALNLKTKRRPQQARTTRSRDENSLIGMEADLSDLAEECFRIAIDTLFELGFSHRQSSAAMKRALHEGSKGKPSLEILDRYHRLSSMLNCWRRDKRYLTPTGTPKVIPIRGRGATFETLARRLAPAIPLDTLVECICQHGDATRPSKDRLALIGSNVLIYKRTPQLAMSLLNDNLRSLSSTTLSNMKIPQELKGTGNFQRIVKGWLTKKDFRKFAKEIRPQLQDLCNVVEAELDDGKGRTGSKRSCGMSLYIFQNAD